MGSTANGLVYPELTDAPNGPGGIQAMGVSVDARYGLTVADWAALLAVATPFAGMQVFVTSLGDRALYNGTKWLAPQSFVRKTADEPIASNTTIQNDDELLLAVPAAGTYVVELFLKATSAANAAGDIGLGFTFPTGTLEVWEFGPDVGLVSGTVQTGNWNVVGATSGVLALTAGLSTANVAIYVRGLLIASASGTIRLQWAQASSSVSASTVKIGSHMTMRNVA